MLEIQALDGKILENKLPDKNERRQLNKLLYAMGESMEIVVFLFKAFWVVGFLSGLAAAVSMSALNKHAVGAPRLLKLFGVSLLFGKYYPNHNKLRKVALTLEFVCIACILLGFLVLLVGVPEFRDLIFKSMGSRGV